LRSCEAKLGVGSRRAYQAVRSAAAGLERDRPMEGDIAAVAALIAVSGVA
jgi:histidine ammonia-lyase